MVRSAGVASVACARVGNDLLSCVVKHTLELFKVLVMFFSVSCNRRLLGENYAGKESGTGGKCA